MKWAWLTATAGIYEHLPQRVQVLGAIWGGSINFGRWNLVEELGH